MITKLKIINFKSFVGEHAVYLDKFCSIACYWDTGLGDLKRALEYVLGADVTSIGENTASQLLSDYWLSRCDYPQVVVEIAVEQASGPSYTFSRCFVGGAENFKIDEEDVSPSEYRNRLVNIGYRSTVNNRFIFSQVDYLNALNDDGGLEKIIGSFLGFDSTYDEIQRRRKQLDLLNQEKRLASEKLDIQATKLLDAEVFRYENLLGRKTLRDGAVLEKLRRELYVDDAAALPGVPVRYRNGLSSPEEQENLMDVEADIEGSASSVSGGVSGAGIVEGSRDQRSLLHSAHGGGFVGGIVESSSEESSLDDERDLTQDVRKCAEEDVALSALIFHRRVQNACKRNDIPSLISLETELLARKHEVIAALDSLAQRQNIFEEEQKSISNAIAASLAQLDNCRKHRDLRLTKYGRLLDRIEFGEFRWIVQEALGIDPSRVHIVETQKIALEYLPLVEERQIEERQSFLALEDPRLRAMLFDLQDRTRIELKNVSEVLELCAKLEDFGAAPCRLQICREGAIPDDLPPVPEDTVLVFLETGEYVNGRGCFGCINRNTDKNEDESIADVVSRISSLRVMEEEIGNNLRGPWMNTYLLKLEKSLLEAEQFILAREITDANRRTIVATPYVHQIDPIYDEYAALFEEARAAVLSEESASMIFPDSVEGPSVIAEEEEIKRLATRLSSTTETLQQLQAMERRKQSLARQELFEILEESVAINRPYIFEEPPIDPIAYSESLQIQQLREQLNSDDINWYITEQELIVSLIARIQKDIKELDNKIRKSSNELDALETVRRDNLLPVLEHCNDLLNHLGVIFGDILHDAELFFGRDTLVDTKISTGTLRLEGRNCNSLIRCIVLAVAFLRIVSFKKMRIVILGDMEPCCPLTDKDIPVVLREEDAQVEENMRAQLLLLVGKLFQMAIGSESFQIPNGASREDSGDHSSGPMGLDQIIVHTNDDIAFCAKSHLVVWKQVLEDEIYPGGHVEISKLGMLSQFLSSQISSECER